MALLSTSGQEFEVEKVSNHKEFEVELGNMIYRYMGV
jgi:hypothetical protein